MLRRSNTRGGLVLWLIGLVMLAGACLSKPVAAATDLVVSRAAREDPSSRLEISDVLERSATNAVSLFDKTE